MRINLPIFKDKDAKDAVTYQSWRWDLIVYQHARCRDCTLLPHAIRSLQGYPGELVWSSGMDITLDDVLTILDEHYNNVKLLDALNKELNQLWMADEETVSDWGICLSRLLQVLAASFTDCFPPDCVAELEERLLLWQTFQMIKSNGSLSEGGSAGEDILRLPKDHQGGWEGRFYRVAPMPQTPNCWWSPKPRTTSFFPLRRLKGNQPLLKNPAVCLAHLEEEDASDDEDPESDDPGRIKGVTEEFMVHLARAVKDAQGDEKCCYHCSSPEHFICNCLLVKTSRDKKQLNGKEGMALMKGAQTPSTMMSAMKSPQMEAPKA